MSEPEATRDEPPAPAFDFSAVHGLQTHLAADATSPGFDDAARREALARELGARAARLAEAVDDALVLANDGVIRWLGDPIAKLAAGEALLAPRAVLLADEALPAEGRALAERRVSLWLAEHMRKALGPLIALADETSIPEAAREIALKVSQALGVLERERIRSQIKALDQDARGALRKLGVRFGAHYIFVPALLKPSARTLCAHLWTLSRGEAADEGAAEKLLHFAASGRTSFAVEPPASSEVYRIAGFRLCGERAVRVDIIERLSDMIRAAMPRPPASSDAADGFVVTSQMTSLTGCSGEHFASILRSLGFVGHAVKKSDYLAAAASRAAAPAPASEPGPASAPPSDSDPAGAPASDAAAAEPVAAEAAEAPAVAEPAPPAVEEATSADAAPPAGEPEAEVAKAPKPAAASEDETIEVWRPAPRRPRHPPHRHRGPPSADEPHAAHPPAEGRPRGEAGQNRRPWRERKNADGPPSESGESASKPERSGAPRRGPPPRRFGDKNAGPGGDRRADRHSEPAKTGNEAPRPSGGEPRKPSVNLDSPFAKLLDLKPLLQSRDKSR